jgi:hypothetical protein
LLADGYSKFPFAYCMMWYISDFLKERYIKKI